MQRWWCLKYVNILQLFFWFDINKKMMTTPAFSEKKKKRGGGYHYM